MSAIDLKTALPSLLPLAVEWAEVTSWHGTSVGVSLNDAGQAIARRVGVQQPDRIRVAIVDDLPRPSHPMLRTAAIEAGFLGPGMAGITLGYSVFVRRGQENTRLLSHEFRHVCQYEQAGSIAAFLPVYLQQIVEVGYRDAPFEIDARSHEIDG